MDSPRSQNRPADMDNLAGDEFDTVLLELINHRLGIVVKASQLSDLQKIVVAACKEFNLSKNDYLQQLTSASIDSPVMKNLISSITIGETYFFRDQKQMQLLQQKILPELIARKRQEKDLSLRIWSAGCASGEELYSIIIMLDEMLPDIDSWHLHLLGTDINAKVLQKALTGIYGEWSMRAISDYYKNKYLARDGQSYFLDKNIIKRAQFNYLNLNDNSYPAIVNGTQALDLILCRNVLIYFDATHSSQIMHKFNSSLVEHGYLLLGASDPVDAKGTHLVLQPEHGKLLTKDSQTLSKVTILEKVSPKTTMVNVVPLLPKVANKTTNVAPHLLPSVDFATMIKQSHWDDLLMAVNQHSIEQQQSAALLALKASALANLGKLKEALTCCEKSLQKDPINLQTHFTYAMILLSMDDKKLAEAELRKTLFLDRDFVMGHYQLGMLLMRNDHIPQGLKSLQNAYNITQSKDPKMDVPGYENLTYGKLTDILHEEIQLRKLGSEL
jgi:chemotaxis protein methyltransferase CheR